MARVMVRDYDTHALLLDGFLILAESLAELGMPPPSRKQERIARLVQLERQMSNSTPAERMSAAMTELGIGRSYYYEIRAEAIEQSLLTE